MTTEQTSEKPQELNGAIGWLRNSFTAAKAGYTAFGFMIGAAVWAFSAMNPAQPHLLTTGSEGPFHIPSLVYMEVNDEKLNDIDNHLDRLNYYSRYRIANDGTRPFKNAQIRFDGLGHGVVQYIDQSEQIHNEQQNLKPISIGNLTSGQSITLLLWSEKRTGMLNPPLLSHDEGSERIMPDPLRDDNMTEYQAKIILSSLFIGMVVTLTGVIVAIFAFRKLIVDKLKAVLIDKSPT